MIVLAAMLLALVGQQEQTDTQGRTLVRTYRQPVNGTERCLRTLPADSYAEIPITCSVNSIGGPTRCTFEAEVTPQQRYATECVARGYRFNWSDGRPATGARVRFTVRLRVL